MADRFVVGSVTGWAITPTSIEAGRKRVSPSAERTVWYVYDSAYCYRPVKEFRWVNAERRARALAAELNA